MIEFSHQNARGPSYARYFQGLLIDDEEFCLQVDAHSVVVQDWDVQLLRIWEQTSNEHAIISSQPLDISFVNKNNHMNNPHLCQAKIDERLYPSSLHFFSQLIRNLIVCVVVSL